MTKQEIKKLWWNKSRASTGYKVAVMMGIRKSPTLEEWKRTGVRTEKEEVTAGMINLYRRMSE